MVPVFKKTQPGRDEFIHNWLPCKPDVASIRQRKPCVMAKGRGSSRLTEEGWTDEQAFPFLFHKISGAPWRLSGTYWAAQQKSPEKGGSHTGHRCFSVLCLYSVLQAPKVSAPIHFPLMVSLIGSKIFWALSNIVFAYNVFSRALLLHLDRAGFNMWLPEKSETTGTSRTQNKKHILK